MRWWTRAPWWVLALWTGGLFGALQVVLAVVDGRSYLEAAVSGVISGAVFGCLMGGVFARINRRYLDAQGDIPRELEDDVRRATYKGPLPTDPQVRAATIRVADHLLATTERQAWALAIWVLLTLLTGALAIADSLWWLIFFAAFIGVLFRMTLRTRRIKRRRDLMVEAQAESA